MPIIGSACVAIASASSAPAGATFGGLNRFPRLTPGATVQRPLCGLAHGPDITDEICDALRWLPEAIYRKTNAPIVETMLPDMFRLVGDLSCLGHSAELAVTESGRAEAQLILIVFAAQLKSCPEFGQLSGSEPA